MEGLRKIRRSLSYLTVLLVVYESVFVDLQGLGRVVIVLEQDGRELRTQAERRREQNEKEWL